jgi:hypothetical protein
MDPLPLATCSSSGPMPRSSWGFSKISKGFGSRWAAGRDHDPGADVFHAVVDPGEQGVGGFGEDDRVCGGHRQRYARIVSRFNSWVDQLATRLVQYEEGQCGAVSVAGWRSELALFKQDPVRND